MNRFLRLSVPLTQSVTTVSFVAITGRPWYTLKESNARKENERWPS
jgi:hypothetical protein